MAEWQALVGRPEQAVLAQPLPGWAPAEIVQARRRLDSLRALDLLHPLEATTGLADALDLAIADVADPRAVTIMADRLFADDKATLKSIGQGLKVTRQRVLQLERQTLATVKKAIASRGGLVEAVAAVLSGFEGVAYPLADMLARMPALGDTVHSVQQPVWRVLDRLSDDIEIAGGWCVRPSMRAAVESTRAALAAVADAHGVASLGAARLVVMDDPASSAEAAKRWVRHCGIVVEGYFALTRTSLLGDYAAATLALAGEPLSSQQIVGRFAGEYNEYSLREQMAGDDRFDRVDRDKWGLREWGFAAYSGIREEIGRLLDRCGGSVPLEDLVMELTGRFSVSARNVVFHAGLPPFQRRDGIVSRSSSAMTPAKRPEQTAKLFRVPGGWTYRVRVSKDHLHGSGLSLPVAMAPILGLRLGGSRVLTSPEGPQSVYWTMARPSLGTIRRFLAKGGVKPGAEAFLVFNDTSAFEFVLARPPVGEPLADALRLVNRPATADFGKARRALAKAIRLPKTSSWAEIIAGYEGRGDHDIAELLARVRRPSKGVAPKS
ncbi:MAG: hypothetical protein LBL55_03315 [Propionibacteriaceae bacterium]|nr:hypothetical protein [Propionibacteriaceae bacterium]